VSSRMKRYISSSSKLGLISFSLIISNGLAFSYSAYVVLTLSTIEVSAFGALFALITIGGGIGYAIQASIAKSVAQDNGSKKVFTTSSSIQNQFNFGVSASAYTLLLCIVLVVPLARFFSITGFDLALASIALIAFCLNMVAQGIYQGEQRDKLLALVIVTFAIGRSIGGLIGLLGGESLRTTLIGFAIGSSIASIFSIMLLNYTHKLDFLRPLNKIFEVKKIKNYDFGVIGLGIFGFSLLASIDVLLARALLDLYDSAAYVAGSLIAKIALFSSQPFLVFLYPKMVTGRSQRPLILGFIGSLAMGVSLCLATFMFDSEILNSIDGATNSLDQSLLTLFVIQGTLFGLIQLLLYWSFANKKLSLIGLQWLFIWLCGILVILPPDTTIESILRTSIAVCLILILVSVRIVSKSRLKA